MTTNVFHPSLLLLFLDLGSGMGKNQDPGSGINIPDPQHCSPDLILSYRFLKKIPLSSVLPSSYKVLIGLKKGVGGGEKRVY
jgi:hypothetical protein